MRGAAGWSGSLYLATRHFAGWYMVNVLDLPSEDVAIALGHTDGGELVRRLYGHRDHERALDRVTAAYEQTAAFSRLGCGRSDKALGCADTAQELCLSRMAGLLSAGRLESLQRLLALDTQPGRFSMPLLDIEFFCRHHVCSVLSLLVRLGSFSYDHV